MPEFSSYPSGTPCWVDLATTDLKAAKAFYMGLFGWTAEDVPSPQGPYTMFSLQGSLVAAAYEMDPDTVANDIPAHWASYISVADLEATLSKVTAAGGTVVQPPDDVPGSGRMAAAQDPAAAVFALWEPQDHFGTQRANEPGALVWNELQVYEPDPAKAFYSQVFGWEAITGQGPTGEYTSFMLDEKPVAGMMAIQPEWGPVPPNWSVYLGVADAEEAAGYAAANGGRVEVPPMEIPGMGRFTLLQDPQGAYFYGMQSY